MIRTALAAGALVLATISPLRAQMPASAGAMTASDVGMQPMMGVAPTDYVSQAAASDMYEIQAAKIAKMKGKSPAVKSFADMMIRDRTTTTNMLETALKSDKQVPPPPMMLPSDKQALIDQLRSTPSSSFDTLYWLQQLQAHQQASALHKGFATDGSDPALRQFAAIAVPIVEQHLAMIKQNMGGAGAM